MRDDVGRRGRSRAVLDGVIGDQLRRAGVRLERRDGDLGDALDFEQHRFDLGQFDAVAAQLHLRVDAAEIFDLALGIDAAEVAGAVDAARGIVGDRQEIGDELGLRQVEAVEIALGDADAGDADLAGIAHRQRLRPLGIEDDDAVGRQRPADGDGLVRATCGRAWR